MTATAAKFQALQAHHAGGGWLAGRGQMKGTSVAVHRLLEAAGAEHEQLRAQARAGDGPLRIDNLRPDQRPAGETL